jgi:hypothetical protein
LDTAPPGITITSPLEGAQYIAKRDNIKIDFNVTDTLDPSPTVSAYLTDVEDGTRVDVMSGQSIDPLSIDDGFWTMTVEAVDRAGNSSSLTTGQFEVIHDVQPPRTSISVGAPQYSGDQFYVTSATSFSVTAVDDLVEVGDGDGLGVALTEYLIDNGFWTTYGSPFTVSGDGPHTIYFRSTDVVGNAEETKSLAVVVDDTPPESSVVAPYPYWSDAVPFAVSADVSDALSGVASAELYYRSSTDGASWTEWKSFGADDTAPYEWSFTAPDGCAVYEFYSAAADVLGNVESAPERADASCGTAISATVDIDPDTLNLKSNGRWITAYIELPSGYDLTSVNIGTITLENVVPAEPRPTAIGDHDHDGISDLMVKFDRSAVQALVSVGDVKLTVTGKWHAVLFSGSDNIRVINPGQKQGNDNKPGQSDGHQGCGNQGGHGNGDQGNNGQCGDHGSSESHGQDNQGDQCNGQGHGNQDNQCDQGQSHGSQGGQGDQENGLPPQTPPGQNDQGNQGQGNQGDQGNEQGSSGGQSSDNQSPAGTPQEQGGSQGPSGQDNQAQSGQCSQTPPEQDGQSSGQSDQGNQGGNEGNGQGNSGNQNGQGGTPPGQSGGQGQGKGKNK